MFSTTRSLNCIIEYFFSNFWGYYSATPICPIFEQGTVAFFITCILVASYFPIHRLCSLMSAIAQY